MENVNVELIAVVVGMVISGIVVGAFVWATSKNASAAIVQAVEVMTQNVPAMDAIEATIEELPDEVNAFIDALVSIGIRYAEGTATEADDAILEMLRKMTDGEPNEPEPSNSAMFMPTLTHCTQCGAEFDASREVPVVHDNANGVQVMRLFCSEECKQAWLESHGG